MEEASPPLGHSNSDLSACGGTEPEPIVQTDSDPVAQTGSDSIVQMDSDPVTQTDSDSAAQILAQTLIQAFPMGSVVSPEELRRLSPATLAYLGDGVYELYVRLSFLFPPKRIQAYHHQVVEQVRAETQADHLRSLQPHLSLTEQDIVKRGRNGATQASRKRNLEAYRQASALETLIGHLYLTDPERLMELLARLPLGAEPLNSGQTHSELPSLDVPNSGGPNLGQPHS